MRVSAIAAANASTSRVLSHDDEGESGADGDVEYEDGTMGKKGEEEGVGSSEREAGHHDAPRLRRDLLHSSSHHGHCQAGHFGRKGAIRQDVRLFSNVFLASPSVKDTRGIRLCLQRP
jgi:hypothetical protein